MAKNTTTLPEKKIEYSGKMLTPKELSEMLDSMTEGMEITSDYLEFEVGQVERLIVVGTVMIDSKEKEKKERGIKTSAVRFINREGRSVISAASVISTTLSGDAERVMNGDKKPFAVQITYRGKRRGNSGYDFDDFEIKPLYAKN